MIAADTTDEPGVEHRLEPEPDCSLRLTPHGISSALGEGYTARPADGAPHPSRLTIESHGRACEVGRFLTEDERRHLAVRLGRLAGKTSESPALAP